MTDRRLSREDWVKAGLRALGDSGFTALKADTLAKALGVSRGSFYWHFADLSAFHVAVLASWQQIAYAAIVAELDGPADERLRQLLARAFRADTRLERAIRAWAVHDAEVRRTVTAIDEARLDYLGTLLREAGLLPARARHRARFLYWAYLGRVFSPDTTTERQLSDVLEELAILISARV